MSRAAGFVKQATYDLACRKLEKQQARIEELMRFNDEHDLNESLVRRVSELEAENAAQKGYLDDIAKKFLRKNEPGFTYMPQVLGNEIAARITRLEAEVKTTWELYLHVKKRLFEEFGMEVGEREDSNHG